MCLCLRKGFTWFIYDIAQRNWKPNRAETRIELTVKPNIVDVITDRYVTKQYIIRGSNHLLMAIRQQKNEGGKQDKSTPSSGLVAKKTCFRARLYNLYEPFF